MNIAVAQKYFHKEHDLISIIIPCYNREDYIEECLDSIFSQTAPPSLYEVICTDDGSTDSTVAIIKQYEKKYPDQLLLIECEENSGGYIGKVRNIGMQYASGSYILFIDPDDYLSPDALEKLYLGALVTQADIVVAGFILFYKDRFLGMSAKKEFLYDIDRPSHFKLLQENEGINGTVCCKLYSADFLKKYQFQFREDFHLAEDNIFHENTITHVHKYYVLGQNLYYYRQNPQGTWNTKKTYQNIYECFRAQMLIYETYCSNYKNLFYERYHEYFDEYYAWKTCDTIAAMKKKCDDAGQHSYFQELWPSIRNQTLQHFPAFETYSFFDENEEVMKLFKNNP